MITAYRGHLTPGGAKMWEAIHAFEAKGCLAGA
jgi:hypothetical protein